MVKNMTITSLPLEPEFKEILLHKLIKNVLYFIPIFRGGQILRTAISLSAILKIPITVNNIRGGRSSPGLRPQHLTGLWLIRDICCGKLVDDYVGSMSISFDPGDIIAGNYIADAKTAGSVCLLLQVALPCLLFAKPGAQTQAATDIAPKSGLTLRGGTNAEMAPQIDFIPAVLCPTLSKHFGLRFDLEIIKRGYFPKGGGEIRVQIDALATGRSLGPMTLTERGRVCALSCRSFVAGVLPIKMANIAAREAETRLTSLFPAIRLHTDIVKEPAEVANGNGSGIMLTATTTTQCILSSSGLGKRGFSAEEVGSKAAKDLCDIINCGACVDEHVQDQVIIFMALAEGRSCIRTGPITLHTESVIYIVEMMLPDVKFEIKSEPDGTNLLTCQGVGFTR